MRKLFSHYFSITVRRISMKLGVVIVPNSGCLGVILWLCSSFNFGVKIVLNVSRFVPIQMYNE